MTIKVALTRASARLKKAGIPQPRAEAEYLLAFALKKPISSLLAHPETSFSKSRGREFLKTVARRARHEPFAYIVGERWFYGRRFFVNEDVLVPRPETETMIEAVLDAVRTPPAPSWKEGVTILDIGTGSGAIGLTLAAELPQAKAILADVSPKSLAVARKNARRLGLSGRVSFKKLDIMKKNVFSKTHDREFLKTAAGWLIVTANLPYLPTAAWKKAMPEVRRFEPKIALASGRDGLDHYRALMARLGEWKLRPDLLLLEADPPQFRPLKKMVMGALPGYRIEIKKDLAGRARILLASKG